MPLYLKIVEEINKIMEENMALSVVNINSTELSHP